MIADAGPPAPRRIAGTVLVAWAMLALALSILGCRQGSEAPATVEPGLLRLAGPDDVPTLDPAMGYDDLSWLFELLLFEPLLQYGEGLEPEPALARRVEVTDAGREVLLEIRRDATFSHGRRVSARDVVASLTRVIDPRTHSPGAEFFRGIRGAVDFAEGRRPSVDGLKVIDDFTLRISLTAPDPLFRHKLAMPFTAPVPVEFASDPNVDFAHRPVGSGPFRLTEWRPGERLRLERREAPTGVNSAIPTTPVRTIEWASGVSEQLAWLRFRSGALDVVRRLPFEERGRLGAGSLSQGRVIRGPQLVTGFLGLNASVPPLDRTEARVAIARAVDRARLVALSGGIDAPAAGILPPGMPGYRPRPIPTPDLAAARTALRQAGLPDGFRTALWVRNDPPALLAAEAIALDLARVGIDVAVKPVTWGALLQATRVAGLVPMFLMRWQADFPDPSNFLDVLFHSRGIGENNSTFLADPTLDRELDLAAPLPPGALRWQAYERIEDAVLERMPRVPLEHPGAMVVVGARVEGYQLHPMRPERLQDVRLR